MLAPFAAIADVIAVYGTLNDDQTATVPGLIAEAMGKLRSETRDAGVDLDAVIWADPVKMVLAKAAVTNAVKRVLTNTDGASRVSYSIDDYREDVTYDDATNGPKIIYIDPADLSGLIPKKRGKWGTIRMGAAL